MTQIPVITGNFAQWSDYNTPSEAVRETYVQSQLLKFGRFSYCENYTPEQHRCALWSRDDDTERL